MLFKERIGFSGTPSDLMPRELGTCDFEPGSEGSIVHTLTNPQICSFEVFDADWTVTGLLDRIAVGGFHALIDTGALITGLSNKEVAVYLLGATVALEFFLPFFYFKFFRHTHISTSHAYSIVHYLSHMSR